MTQHDIDRLQSELMVAGMQLLYNVKGRIASEEDLKALSQWARVQAEPMARRLRL